MNYPTIILVRHGQTIWNKEGRFQGRLNSPLTQKGELQAKENSFKLKKNIENITNIKIFSSPLGRARDTAYIICDELGINRDRIIFDDRIIEFNYGIFEGQKREDMMKRQEFQDREANKWSYQIENGESYILVEDRVKDFLDDIKDEKKVIIVAHEMVNRTIRGVYCNYNKDMTLKLRQPNNIVLYLQNREEKILT
ncbi:MAG TPA: histidine phosphatase family protein [Campylobacterales bacterium]|nr:histidine phosphatase family protein [Campylobacterales bacterium]